MSDEPKSGVGHNSGGITAGQLKSVIERVERLEEDRKGISNDIKEIYAEAEGNGLDPKIIRMIVRLRKMDASARREQEDLLDCYKAAIGMAD